MRVFEIILICIAVVWISQTIFKFDNFAKGLAMLSFFAIAGHLIFEGFRWQMLPVYLVLVCFLIGFVLNLKIQAMWVKWSLWTICLIAIVISSLLSYLIPVFKVPSIKGKFEIVSVDEVTNQGIKYKLWLPLSQKMEQTSRKKDRYLSGSSKSLSGIMGMPGFLFSHLKLVRTNANEMAEGLQISKQPLIIYSHGASSTHLDNTILLEKLASAGYAVMSVDHDFTFEKYGIDKNQAKKIEIEAQTDLIDQLIDEVVPHQAEHYYHTIRHLQKTRSEEIDFSKIGLMGHSLGGTTAVTAGVMVPNAKAAINLDGPIDPSFAQGFDLPLLYMSSFSPYLEDEELEKKRVPAEFYRGVKSYELKTIESVYEQNLSERYWLRFKEANHLDFTDVPYIIPFMSAPKYERERGNQIKSEIILNFLDRTIKGKRVKVKLENEDIDWLVS